mgnify:CR=1 FL=1
MSVLSDKSIRKLAVEQSMISPFIDKQVRDGKISYGLSSFGYDARVGDEFKIFHNVNSSIVDPKEFSSDNFVTKKSSDYIIIPPNSFALGTTIEVFKIPRDIMCIVVGKSTYARTGIIVNVTPIESEFFGTVTLEFSNTTPLPAKIPTRCPFAIGINPSILLIPVESCVSIFILFKGSGGVLKTG